MLINIPNYDRNFSFLDFFLELFSFSFPFFIFFFILSICIFFFL